MAISRVLSTRFNKPQIYKQAVLFYCKALFSSEGKGHDDDDDH